MCQNRIGTFLVCAGLDLKMVHRSGSRRGKEIFSLRRLDFFSGKRIFEIKIVYVGQI